MNRKDYERKVSLLKLEIISKLIDLFIILSPTIMVISQK